MGHLLSIKMKGENEGEYENVATDEKPPVMITPKLSSYETRKQGPLLQICSSFSAGVT